MKITLRRLAIALLLLAPAAAVAGTLAADDAASDCAPCCDHCPFR